MLLSKLSCASESNLNFELTVLHRNTKILFFDFFRLELKKYAIVFFFDGVTYFVESNLVQILTFVTIIANSIQSNVLLLPSHLILIMSFFTTLCFSIGDEFIPAVANIVSAKISLKRVEVKIIKNSSF
jgi:hypothetical protein